MLEFDGIRVSLGAFQLCANLKLAQGGVTALMGASGSGKSTLLSVAAGFLPPSTGAVRVDGQDVTALAPGQRPISMLFQDNNLFPHLTVLQNVGLGIRPDLRLSADQRRDREAMLDRVGLATLGDRRPRDLSGGQQSRAALARALLSARHWMLLDEPFAALGPALRRDMMALLRETTRAQGISVLMVTHDPVDAQSGSDHTAILADGTVAAPQPTAALFADPPPALRAYLGR